MNDSLPTAAPQWALDAWTRPTTHDDVTSAGAAIRYRCWNSHEVRKPGLLFVHGFLAHSRWWDHVAPQFTESHRVYAMDLAGMGDSGYRDDYSLLTHSLDIAEVIEHAGIGPAIVVGHSYGGSRLLRLCVERPELIALAVAIDSAVFVFEEDALRPAPEIVRVYRAMSYAALRARYRLIPPQPVLPWALDYITHHSMKPVGDDWTWKFDNHISAGWPERDGAALLSKIKVPVAFAYGETSEVVSHQRAARIADLLGIKSHVVAGAGHHVLLDQPLETIRVLRLLLGNQART